MQMFIYKWKIDNAEYVGTANFNDMAELLDHVNKIGGKLIEVIEHRSVADLTPINKDREDNIGNKDMVDQKQKERVFLNYSHLPDMPFLIKWTCWYSIIGGALAVILTVMVLLVGVPMGLPIYNNNGQIITMSVWTRLAICAAVILCGIISIFFNLELLTGRSWARRVVFISTYAGIGFCVFMLVKSFSEGTNLEYVFKAIVGIVTGIFVIFYFNLEEIKTLYTNSKKIDKNNR